MSKLKIEKASRDTHQRSFHELKARETFMFGDRVYVKAYKEDFYGDCIARANGENGDGHQRQLNCFCLTTGTFGSFRNDTTVTRVAMKKLQFKDEE